MLSFYYFHLLFTPCFVGFFYLKKLIIFCHTEIAISKYLTFFFAVNYFNNFHLHTIVIATSSDSISELSSEEMDVKSVGLPSEIRTSRGLM